MDPSHTLDVNASSGYCFVDGNGNIITEGSNPHQASAPVQAECWAVWDALTKASQLNLRNFTLKYDSLKAVLICNMSRPIPCT